MKNRLLLLLSFVSFPFLLHSQSLTLPRIFSDGMVLQQRSSAPVWGRGTPGATIAVTASWGAKASATVKEDGRWQVALKTPKPGGPFTITVLQDTARRTLRDVLIGEVWLCSGQSNMEMPMRGFSPKDSIDGATVDILNASYPTLRMFTEERAISAEPRSDCSGAWVASSPAAAGSFSATAFHFGRRLLSELKVPIGLIHASWGGTPVQAWTSAPFISTLPAYTGAAERLKKAEEESNALQQWLTTLPSVDISVNRMKQDWHGLSFGDSALAYTNAADKDWPVIDLPRGWEWTEVGPFDGVVWFRTRIALPAGWRGRELAMELGPIDDVDEAYVNGALIGETMTGSPYNVPRVYTIPAPQTKDSLMTIAVRVIDFGGGGGFWGAPEQMVLHPAGSPERLPLSGAWRYKAVAEIRGNTAYRFGTTVERPRVSESFDASAPSSLYNGMIVPLVPYGIAGAIWYQGESNTQDPEAYDTLFPLMVRNWRADWKQEFPFYYVQIAPYEYGSGTRSERLRESQLRALTMPKSGMAVTLDIGDALNIHPANKKDAGARLARWALAKQYGRKMEYSGPVYRSMKAKNGVAVLTFDHAEGLQLRPSADSTLFTIAGADGVFHPAVAEVSGKVLIISSPEVPVPAAVRYAWKNVVQGALFNGAGLPASSFRTDIEK